MQPKTLEQILSELNPVYDPQIASIKTRQASIPGQIQAEEQGLQARQDTAFGDILSGARRRGLGFSGIPLQEQARYTSDNYLPALARLRQSGREQAMSLEDAILGIQEKRSTMAQQLRQQELDRAEQQRQFDQQLAAQQRAAAAARAMPTLGNFGSAIGTPAQSGGAKSVQRGDKGFNFFDAGGNPISAAQYAQLKGQSFRSVLEEMANAGDQGARQALGFVGDDFGYDPNKVNTQSLADLYNALVWGTGRSAAPYTRTQTPLNSYGNWLRGGTPGGVI